ncbi:MAG: hypothetical protein ABEJ26_14400 [Halosimplex sp.]
MNDRAQAFTIEAFVASLLLLGSIIFALQVTGATANTASTSSGHVERRLDGATAGVLDAARSNGSIRPTILYWNSSGGAFHDASDSHYVASRPPTRFGALLERTLGRPHLAYNLDVRYVGSAGQVRTQHVVRYGTPSDQAVTADQTVTLYDDDRVRTATGRPGPETLAEADFYAPDAAPDSPVYNVVRVEVTVWYV